jgi:WhiB family redox-sensing transcriptional regulator
LYEIGSLKLSAPPAEVRTTPPYNSDDPRDDRWMVDGLCRDDLVDPQLFFPSKKDGGTTARAICSLCVVQLDCLNYALDNNEQHGVWGGTTDKERRRIRKQISLGARVVRSS